MRKFIHYFLLLSILKHFCCEDIQLHPENLIMRKILDSEPSDAFRMWRQVHQREYQINSEEGLKRFHNFKKNLDIVKAHNTSGKKSYTLTLNHFADMSLPEFHEKYLKGNAKMYKNLKNKYGDGKIPLNFWDLPEEEEDEYLELFLNEKIYTGAKIRGGIPSLDTPIKFESIDWIEKGHLKEPIENQGTCGSCWAFSSVSAIEAAYAIKYGKTIKLSQQQLIDCDKNSSGCDGGYMHEAMAYVKENGIELEKSYPYLNEVGQCSYKKDLVVTKISDFESCFDNPKCATAEGLYQSLKKGPVAAVVDATEEFMLYESGVFDQQCTEVNHAILVVAYHQKETEDDTSYWVVKNSWGHIWGDHGFIKIKHSTEYNNCLLNSYYVRPIL